MNLPEALSLIIIVFAGTGGELAVSRAMKQIGEVHDFSPGNVARVVGRAFRIGWMWFGISLMTAAFFALLAMLCMMGINASTSCGLSSVSITRSTWPAASMQ